MNKRTRIKNLPQNIVSFDGKKETTLTLQKTKRILAYNIEIRNLLLNI